MAIIYLIACAKQKQLTPSRAEEMYISPLYRKSKAYALLKSDSWFILSAKYGLLKPNKIIDPYEQTLKTMPHRDRISWAEQTLKLIVSHTSINDHLVFLAGKDYTEHLLTQLIVLGYSTETPLSNMSIGNRLRWLNNQLKLT